MMDGIELEILWGNLVSIVSEQAKALQRTAFSPIVREAGDLATALFDADARMVAQGLAGTPGHQSTPWAPRPKTWWGSYRRRRFTPGTY